MLADQVGGDALLLARLRASEREETPEEVADPAHRGDCILASVRRSQQPGRFAERVVEGVDDGGSAERIVLWIERKQGGVWAVGRAVNPQYRPSSEPRPEDYLFEGYELQDALDAANERSGGRRERRRARRLDRPPSAVQAQRDPRAAGALVLRAHVILVVAATENELAATGAEHTFCCGIGPAESGVRTAMGLAELRPAAVLHVGIAGARRARNRVGRDRVGGVLRGHRRPELADAEGRAGSPCSGARRGGAAGAS